MLERGFFDYDVQEVAKSLLGKVIRHFYQGFWLSARIIETEAYYRNEKGSHASLGFTEKRKALFMEPGTIYMYYARGGDSLNVSCKGDGNAVLIKSAFPWFDKVSPENTLNILRKNNPIGNSKKFRSKERLCNGQTLLCKSLGIKVMDWDSKQFDRERFYFDDIGDKPKGIVQTTRLGIPKGRDEHLPYRFIDQDYIKYCTKNPIKMRKPPMLYFLA